MGFPDRLDDAFILFARRPIDLVMLVLAGDGAVGRHFDHAQLVDLHELFGLGRRRPGHAGKLFVEAEVVLERHGCQRRILRLDLDAFLGFDGLMQALGQAAALHHAPGELVDQHDLAVAHDILLVLVEQRVRAQCLGDMVNQRGAFRVIKRRVSVEQTRLAQQTLDYFVALIGVGDVPGLFVDLVVLGRKLGDQLVDADVKVRPVLRRP